MKCEFVKIGMLSVQIEDAGDGRAQKWHAQPKAGTKDDGIKFFQTFIAESNAPAPDFADPGSDGNPALSNQRQEVLAQRSSTVTKSPAGLNAPNCSGLPNTRRI